MLFASLSAFSETPQEKATSVLSAILDIIQTSCTDHVQEDQISDAEKAQILALMSIRAGSACSMEDLEAVDAAYKCISMFEVCPFAPTENAESIHESCGISMRGIEKVSSSCASEFLPRAEKLEL
jgi:hypothetical protein